MYVIRMRGGKYFQEGIHLFLSFFLFGKYGGVNRYELRKHTCEHDKVKADRKWMGLCYLQRCE